MRRKIIRFCLFVMIINLWSCSNRQSTDREFPVIVITDSVVARSSHTAHASIFSKEKRDTTVSFPKESVDSVKSFLTSLTKVQNEGRENLPVTKFSGKLEEYVFVSKIFKEYLTTSKIDTIFMKEWISSDGRYQVGILKKGGDAIWVARTSREGPDYFKEYVDRDRLSLMDSLIINWDKATIFKYGWNSVGPYDYREKRFYFYLNCVTRLYPVGDSIRADIIKFYELQMPDTSS